MRGLRTKGAWQFTGAATALVLSAADLTPMPAPAHDMISHVSTSPPQRDRNSILLFQCRLKHGGDVAISINREAVTGSTRPLYTVSVRQYGRKAEGAFLKAVEYTQTSTEAKELIIWWSISDYLAKLEYHTDWGPNLEPFASVEITGENKTTRAYLCTKDSIDIVPVANGMPPIPEGKRRVVLNLWSLSYYNLAAEAKNESGDEHEN